jgi:hypothetical protein
MEITTPHRLNSQKFHPEVDPYNPGLHKRARMYSFHPVTVTPRDFMPGKLRHEVVLMLVPVKVENPPAMLEQPGAL